jgi:SAM-dependent methyltransferase
MDGSDRKTIEAREVAYFDEYYAQSGENPVGWKLRLEREIRSLLRAFGGRRPRRALSVGCGDGQFELMLAPHVEHLTALDISKTSIENAKRNATKAGVTNVDFRCLPMSELAWDAHYDCIVCVAFLHHVPEPDLVGFLKSAYDHLTPGGLFYSQDPNVNGVLRKIGRLVLGSRYDRYHSPDERELDPGEIEGALRKVGFASTRLEYIDVTLIPGSIMLAKGPGWPLRIAAGFDQAFCATPFWQHASGFVAIAHK